MPDISETPTPYPKPEDENFTKVEIRVKETEPLLAKKQVSLVLPARDDIRDQQAKERKEKKEKEQQDLKKKDVSYKLGIAVMLFITFLSSICFSIVLPSIWPFLRSLGGNKWMLGWAVAVNSCGSLIASPLFGYWGDRRSTKEVIALSLVVMIAGNIMYSLATDQYILLAGRFIVGVASANAAVSQTYLSYTSTPENRTKIMALNSACTVLGFIIGPALALITTFINFSFYGIHVNENNSAGYLSAVLSLFGVVALMAITEIPKSKRKKGSQLLTPSTKQSSLVYSGSGFGGGGSTHDLSAVFTMDWKTIPWIPVIICNFAYFSYTASFTCFETIGTPYTQHDFGWGVMYNSILYLVLGAICILSLFILQIVVRFVDNDRRLIVVTTFVQVIGFGFAIINFRHPSQNYAPFWQFALCLLFSAFSYSTSVAVIISMYSKVLEGLAQGAMMGWLGSSGSLARIFAPLYASYVFQYGGPTALFAGMSGLMLITTLVLLFSYNQLGPRDKLTIKTPINTPSDI